ncbi:MAG: hypothetical protein WBM84_08920, partial [Sedimenticolaceae bacterium]
MHHHRQHDAVLHRLAERGIWFGENNELIEDRQMKRFQLITLAAAVSMALGMSSVAYANPNNNIESEEGNQNNSVTNTGADSGATAAEYATAEIDNSDNSDNSTN